MGLRKHPRPKKNLKNADRPNGKAWKKGPKALAARLASQGKKK